MFTAKKALMRSCINAFLAKLTMTMDYKYKQR